MNISKEKHNCRARVIISCAILAMLMLVLALTFPTYAENETPDGDYIVIEGKTYAIEDTETLVDADIALIKWNAIGNSTTDADSKDKITGVFDGEIFKGYWAVYEEIYARLLTKADTSFKEASTPTEAHTIASGTTTIYRFYKSDTAESISVKFGTSRTVNGRFILLADDVADLNITDSGKFIVSGGGALIIQGRSDSQRINLNGQGVGASTAKSSDLINVSKGNLYLMNCNISNYNFGGNSAIIFSTGNTERHMYMANSSISKITATEAGGIFCTAYNTSSTGSQSEVEKSTLNINNCTFFECVTTGSATVGGSAIRSYAADRSTLNVTNCTFTNNNCKATGTASGGGAIYWKSVTGSAKLISCTFTNNQSSAVGGAILNMGTMEIIGCRFENNTAQKNGGAIAVEPPYTSSEYTSITGTTSQNKQNNFSGTLTLDSQTKIINNTANQNGGGIYFNAVSSQISQNYQITKYNMQLIINGAEIRGNTAKNSGGGIGIYMNYDDRNYKTGVIINSGSVISENTATTNGGAIWINSADTCDCKENQGVIMNGGTLENNTATNGGALYIKTGKANVEMNYYINGGTVKGNHSTKQGGAAYILGGNVIMSDGKVTDCTASTDGGAVYVASGSFSMSGGSIENVSATQNGGAVYVSGGSFSMSSGSIQNSSATQNGGAVYVSGGSFSMSGGSIQNSSATQNGGAVYVSGGDTTMSGGNIALCKATINGGAIYMTGGAVSMSGDAKIQKCNAQNGGAAYLGGGTMTVYNGSISENTALQNGGGAYLVGGGTMTIVNGSLSQNAASQDGGGAYLAGGQFTVSGGLVSLNTATNGGGALVANGNVSVTGGVISHNTASQNGGAFSITNGDYTMTGGEISNNKASGGDGGAIYVSSSLNNTQIIVRSGSIINNEAGKSGGAFGVYGQDGVKFTITIGSNTSHKDKTNSHVCATRSEADETCPVIENNISATYGGGIYLSGSYDAVMNMHCLVEKGNKVGDGVSPSNFMKVDGGTLNITTVSSENIEDAGNVVINSSIQVTGGTVTISGSGHNPIFNEPVTVDVDTKQGSTFTDNRTGGNARTIQYFENFETVGETSGQYTLVDFISTEPHVVRANMYSNTGYIVEGWVLMTTDSNGNIVPTEYTYMAGDTIEQTGNLIFYAKWMVVGYTIIFTPGVDSYLGSMNAQDFEYSVEQALTANTFINVGYKFVHWYDASDPTKIYENGALVSRLSEVNGTKITLVAVWDICDHSHIGECVPTKNGNSATLQCTCLGYKETVTLKGGTTVTYDGKEHSATAPVSYETLNGISPDPVWQSFDIVYHRVTTPNYEAIVSGIPLNAGSYTASVVVSDDITLYVNIIINKANRTDSPTLPQYEATVDNKGTEDTKDDENVIVILTPDDIEKGIPLEYQFSWYVDETLHQSEWITWDSENPPTQKLSVTYTNYYVDVRYAETENYNASSIVRGVSVIVWTGNVTFKFSSDTGLSHSHVISGGKDGITVTLNPLNGYYLYNVTSKITEIPGYTLPSMQQLEQSSDSWVIWIHNIQGVSNSDGITIDITFSGAEKIATVSSSAAKDQVFDSIANAGEESVTINCDSAYTVHFNVNNYKHYTDPSITFNQSIPVGSTVIMIDQSNFSYWSYTATSAVNRISLSSFVRMGTQNEKFSVSKENLALQFIIDFSGCQSYASTGDLITSFVATPMQPEGLQTVPNMPNANKSVTLVSATAFSIQTEATTSNSLTNSISYTFASVATSDIGISKWNNVCGILIIEPDINTHLPSDARLQVKIGDSTVIYPLINGKYIVSIPSKGTGTANLTLLSDMFPNENKSYNFTISLYASKTNVKTTPSDQAIVLNGASITYTVSETINPAISASIVGSLPKYENGTISSLSFSGEVRDLPDNYTVRGVLYSKNEAGGYTSTTQTINITVDRENNAFSGILSLESFAADMSQATGSLSLMLSVEIVDTNGKTVDSFPLYFILIDTRKSNLS